MNYSHVEQLPQNPYHSRLSVNAGSTPNSQQGLSTASSFQSLLPVDQNANSIREGSSVGERKAQVSEEPHWKPWAIRSPVIIFFIIASISLVVVIEVLVQKSQASGALAPSRSVDEISNSAQLASLYLPTAISVLYGFLFSCIDLDVKRMQPWVELSKSGGASAENSLLLDYDFDFLPFVPVRAARRRHWSVFYAGLMMMAIFWALTPLQSAIFGTGSAQLTQSAVLTSSGGLIPVEEQASLLDASVLNGAFATVWLNQTYPKSLTANSATLPIQAIQIPESASNTIWTGWTWQLTTELSCWPAIQRNGTIYKGLDGPILDNGQGCTVPRYDAANMDGTVPYVIRYIGWYENARLDYWLSSEYCDERFKHQFLAITSNDSDYSANTKVTAQFCEPSYYKQNITVPVSSMTLKPDFSAITEAGPKMELTDAEFNRTSFEYLLGTGVPSFDRLRDYPDEELLEGYYQVKARSKDIPWPIENMPTFAIGSGNWTGVDLMDPSNQSSAYTKAHRAAFSIAVSNLLAESSETQDGSITFQVSGIVVSRTISAVVEGLLVVSALLAGLILLHSWRMQTNLSRDSSSIAGIMKLTQQDESILRHFSPLDQSSEEELRSATEQARFQTHRVGTETHLLRVAAGPDDPEGGATGSRPESRPGAGSQKRQFRPTVLKTRVAFLIIPLLIAGVSVLVVLKQQEIKLGGLPRPSENFEVLQILENYIPTVFATFLEPFWVLVNRIFCLVQPFRTLHKGNATANRSIEVDYTSLMPQLNVLRAIKSSHYFLVMVCTAALLGNVLAVGLGGIFAEAPVDVEYSVQYQPQHTLLPTRDTVDNYFSIAAYRDHLQLVLTNLSSNTTLPAWTSSEAYFLPSSDTLNSTMSTDLRRANTTGVALEPRCSMIGRDESSEDYVHLLYNNTHRQLYVNLRNENSSSTRCYVSAGTFEQWDTSAANITKDRGDLPRGHASNEIYNVLQEFTQGDTFCSKRVLLGWMRVNASAEGVQNDDKGPIANFAVCAPMLVTAPYQVTVDSQGNVVDAQRMGNLTDATPILGNRTESALADILANTISGDNSWHNITVARDWMNAFLKLQLNTTAHIDPDQPLMDLDVMIPGVEAVLKKCIAVLFGLNPSFWTAAGDDVQPIDGVAIRSETRIFMSTAALIVSLVILVLYIIIAVLIYVRGLGVAIPRLPSTMGSVLAYVASSRALRQYPGPDTGGAEKAKNTRYSYGAYHGCDGKSHIGIELASHTRPLKRSRRGMLP
ncbi:hypothetical protein BJ166DRAFT_629399 [Pestalotiopsis sp. NC0098]|nr:hypothetical protein BJ166DRAFT_629399 [Pestalotiopsis sp. NC0098]